MVKPTVALMAIVASLLAFGASAQAATWTWSTTARIDNVALTGIACPSSTLCVAIDTSGRIVRSRDPAGGRRKWAGEATDPDSPLVAIACPSSSLCVAVDGSGGAFVSIDPGAPAPSWVRWVIDPGQHPTAIACPSRRLCVVSDGDQSVITSTDPAGGASAWTRVPVDTGIDAECARYQEECGLSLTGLACPSSRFCVAVDDQGDTVTSSDPAGGPRAWTVAEIDPQAAAAYGLSGLSCPSVSLCVTADGFDSDVLASGKPAGGAPAWSTVSVGFSPAWLSCPLRILCLGNDADTPNFISTDPTGPGSSWRSSDVDSGAALMGVACPTRTSCVAVDNSGGVISGTENGPPVPVSGRRPRITGIARIGDRLLASSGIWTSSGTIHFAYRWQRCAGGRCRALAGADRRSLRVSKAVQGDRLRVLVTASNRYGSTRLQSGATARVAPAHVTAR